MAHRASPIWPELIEWGDAMPYICRNCGNTGRDMLGQLCPCAAGRALAEGDAVKAGEQHVSNVLAKFGIVECSAQRVGKYETNPETGRYELAGAVMASRVKLAAVKGEPFGSATPSGSVDMLIQNPAAARIFQDAWDAYVRSDDPKATAPEFYVTFKLDDGNGSD